MHYVCMHHKDGDSTAFISLDGNFRLCRRKNAGQQSMYEKPLCGDRVFVSQSDVDCYVQSSSSLLVNLGRDSESNKVYIYTADINSHHVYTVFYHSQCHEFKAGDALRSKSRYHALDETGVFGATCRHDIPLKMLSMKQGEK